MDGLDLSTSLINVYGPGTSGKSNFIKYLLSQRAYRRHFVFDPMHEYPAEDFHVYRPDNLSYEGGNEELNDTLGKVLTLPTEVRPRYIVVDEAANYLPGGNKEIGPAADKLAQHNTHIEPGITLITSNRHPTDLDSTLREMYSHMFVFGVRGKNAKNALDNLASGLTDVVEGLGEYQFAHVDPLGNISVFEPVKDMGEYDRI